MRYDNKKIIIYGKNRYQRDFQFIFSHLEVSYYIDDIIQDTVYQIDTLQNENLDEIFVIICKSIEEQSLSIQKLQINHLVHKVNFCIAEELFEELDFQIENEAAGRKIVVWGTGFKAIEFCENYKRNYESLNIDFFVDSDKNKCNNTFYGKKVVHIDDIHDWNSYYIIIAIADDKRAELDKIIEENGFKNNCIPASRLLLEKPSVLLKKTFYDRNQYHLAKCPKLNDMRILRDGNICPCGSVRAFIMGNVFIDKPKDIWNSIYEKIYRLSILNKTHTFCDGKKCPFLVNREEINNNLEAVQFVDHFPTQPYLLLLELDASCNIMCTSCRDVVFVEENDFYESFCSKIIENYLDYSDRLIFTGNGEALVSKYGRRILVSKGCIKRQAISLLTNGLAFNHYNWEKYFRPYSLVDVSVSIDAASEETYLKIRRKSNWNILNDNLKWIQKLKAEGKIGFFQINFVVQKANVHEMADFVRMGKKYQVDRVLLNMLENWKFTDEEFCENSVIDENNRIKSEYKEYFNNDILSDEIVDFTNIAQAVGKYAKNAYMY